MKIKRIVLCLFVALYSMSCYGVSASRPNIIYILADDMGFGDVSCNNENSKIQTPHIDRLGAEGLRCTDAHTSSGVCTPTRYGILTGRYSWRTAKKSGVLQGHSPHLIDPRRETVASFLKKRGYATACIGKWHLGMTWAAKDTGEVNGSTGQNVDFDKPIENGPLDVGFDTYFGISASLNMPPHAFIENQNLLGTLSYLKTKEQLKQHNISGKAGWSAREYKQDQVLMQLAKKSTTWIAAHAKEPFFVYLPLSAPHAPIVPSDDFLDKSGIGTYGDYCLEVDWVVGRILKTLDEKNISKNTLVIFTADNGCSPQAKFDRLHAQGHFPSYVYRGLKGSLWEAGHRVPFLVRWPAQVKPGTQSDRLICTTDLLATVADLHDSKLPDHVGEDSVSFLPVLRGEEQADEVRGGMVMHSDSGHFAIRRGKWKLVLHDQGGTRRKNPADKPVKNPADLQLFDMDKDSSETINIQHEFPEKVTELTMLLADFVNRGRSTQGIPQKNDPMTGRKQWTEIDCIKEYLK